MSKKHKFDLTALVRSELIKEKETLFFVSDPAKTAVITKQPNGEFKLLCLKETMTVHAVAQKFLGQEPPDHASKWLRTQSGKTLYDLWKQDEEMDLAA